ncbi:unnamed protein product [Aphis gossypii]|uniref:RlpA-like protein double-psi beta-barrel domain-containing protein n=1 Tax=Aphis gossypii TaxID=80765 RepID=A0A9P0IX93_APHGO|nr:unnamed protein product [Aphis gossypii]
MKKSSVISIALFVIFTISGIHCDSQNSNLTCADNFDECLNHTDCCSGSCLMTGYVRNRICLASNFSFIEPLKIQKGNCSYYEPENEKVNEFMSTSFGLYASHPLLPTNSMVEVNHDGKTVTVTITNQNVNNNNNSILNLSREAAKELGIEKEGLFECNLQVLDPNDDDYYPLLKPIGAIIIFIAAMFIII